MLVAAITACASPDKEDAKGQVDESEPPGIPTELGKADDASKTIAVDVQSPHPYANNLDKVFPVSLAALPWCASAARLHFKVLRTEANYDFVTIEPVGAASQEFHGTRDNTWSNWFNLNAAQVNVRLESDASVTRHGFEIDKVEWTGFAPSCPNVESSCDGDLINLTRRPDPCQCPAPAVCVPVSSVEVSHQLAMGFNNTTKRARGSVATFTHPGPADGPETDTIGTVDPTRLAALVRRAAEAGLLHGPGYSKPIPSGAFYDRLIIDAGMYRVSFLAGTGAHTAEVQSMIDSFESLFTCGGGGGLTCGSGYDCEQGQCIEDQGCVCPAVYAPVCGAGGQTYSNGCAAGCANATVVHDGECGIAGDMCGGMQGLPCQDDLRCRYGASTFTAPWPDASGTCVAANYCDAPVDCSGLPHIAVPGAWACEANSCAWKTGAAWQTVTGGHFETTNPYANNVSVWHQLYLPAGAQALRLSTTRFRTEANYDKLEVWTWKNGAWAKVRTYTGTVGPALTDEFPGRYHQLRFVSDSSVTAQGVALDAQWR
ncbi:MAG: Kazal-type serine protease inhibitor [Myxococcota bacterium]|nr:Kazal-type serine protease inhibitor [Myxococcota bacterium]